VRLAVLDIGSNTVHLLLVDAHPHGAAPIPASKLKIPLRLAEHLTASGEVDEAAVATLDRLHPAQPVAWRRTWVLRRPRSPSATSALRQALQRQSRTRASSRADGTGDRGADRGRRVPDDLPGRSTVVRVVDRQVAGDGYRGGSLELAIGVDEGPDAAISVPLGAGRLADPCAYASDPPTKGQVRALRKDARAQIAEVTGRLRRFGEPRLAAGTSKTFRQLARIAGAAPSSEGIDVPGR
jgi:exopolyphosphatase/guanosine-5'-triphosphate,3'-diphosphate pyrophosphatase